MESTYTYDQLSTMVCYKGQVFDSLTELKFVLSIENTHAWLRNDLNIYYSVDFVREGFAGGLHTYTPDLLIRNWKTGEATLVEIKPHNYNDVLALHYRRKIARRYIKRFGYDWTFQVIRSDEIILSAVTCKKFNKMCRDAKALTDVNQWQLLQNDTLLSDDYYTEFVRDGVLPAVAI